jgi:phosphoesterase RecJ-like protein
MSIYSQKTLPFPVELLDEVGQLLKTSERIVILSHRQPDGDTIGANLALRMALQQWKKSPISACIDPPPEYTLLLSGVYDFVNDFDTNAVDLLIAVDCGAHYMTRFHEKKPEILSKKIPFLNIDHHPSNDHFGTHNLVHETAAAACFTVYHLLKYLNFTITREMATCLLLGLYFDTGSFMHSNTTPEVLEMAQDLMNKGADFKKIVKGMFHTNTVGQLRLWGRILTRARLNQQGAVVSAVTNQDIQECGASSEEVGGVIDFLNAVPESKFSLLLSEDGRGNVKGSLRTQNENIDLSQLAGLFGGGGHKKASGFSIPGRLQPETTWKIG